MNRRHRAALLLAVLYFYIAGIWTVLRLLPPAPTDPRTDASAARAAMQQIHSDLAKAEANLLQVKRALQRLKGLQR
ncbi:hypothetical protein BOX15_Mlig028924g1 [Macrostomum lignano]|uniref:Uncharacterized protein n=1 Tax=Macrostomum lignano TaxID=282301 RepID=A0A267EXJ7_9PLAT|nr:hypothetical protein BOX15_Mlig028924g1 [Macrostomum lignano]